MSETELERLCRRHQVPGAQLGILRLNADATEASRTLWESGVCDIDTGARVQSSSSFQIGSITKVVTAAASLRAAELGLLSLTEPVRALVPELRLADERVAAEVSIGDLLSHRSGIEGERYRESGEDAGAVARYVDDLADTEQVHPLGRGFSYSNTAYVVAGRALEVATGKPWFDAVRELVLEPLGLTGVAAPIQPDEVESPATGHVFNADGRLERATPWRIPPGMGPAGLLTANASAVLDLLAISLRAGVSAAGRRVLAPASAHALVTPSAPTGAPGITGWAMGWMSEQWGDAAVFGHDGGTNGQFAFARAIPSEGVAYALLTNGGHARALFDELMPLLTQDTTGSPGPTAPRPSASDAHALSPFPETAIGRYRNGDGDLVIDVIANQAVATTVPAGSPIDRFSPIRNAEPAVPADSTATFVWQRDGDAYWRTLVVLDGEDAVLLGTRRMRRVV